MTRLFALLLAIIGGAAGALAIMAGLTAALMGGLWIFVFGDDPWPAWLEPALSIIIPICGLLLSAYLVLLIWRRLDGTRGAA